jgi:hypothetical protein
VNNAHILFGWSGAHEVKKIESELGGTLIKNVCAPLKVRRLSSNVFRMRVTEDLDISEALDLQLQS